MNIIIPRIEFQTLSLVLILSLHAAHAAEITHDTDKIPELKSSEFSDKAPDIKLIVIDENKVEHPFNLHSEALRASKFFSLQFGLRYKDMMLEERYTFHSNSIEDFILIVRLLYGASFKSEEFEYFKKLIGLQERFLINNFNEVIITLLKYHLLHNLPPNDIADLLKTMSRSYSALALQISDIIFQFIALNHKSIELYTEKSFTPFLNGYEDIIFKIKLACSETQETAPKAKSVVKPAAFDSRIYDKARKIHENNKTRGTIVSVFRSRRETEQVMALLKNKYQRSSTLVSTSKGTKSKYQINLS